MIDLNSPDFLRRLTTALVDLEEELINSDCISESCDHAEGECPEPPTISCGDATRLRDLMVIGRDG